MAFDPTAYDPAIAAILAGKSPMALVRNSGASNQARSAIAGLSMPETARAGLYLYAGCWDEAHETAQAIENPDGSYWHAIVHRQEPDAGNSSYWFRRVGRHPIFAALASRASEIDDTLAGSWDPFAFVDYCERAGRQPSGDLERRALAIQQAEWELLFGYCLNPARRG
jgi:hypothetical protein